MLHRKTRVLLPAELKAISSGVFVDIAEFCQKKNDSLCSGHGSALGGISGRSMDMITGRAIIPETLCLAQDSCGVTGRL